MLRSPPVNSGGGVISYERSLRLLDDCLCTAGRTVCRWRSSRGRLKAGRSQGGPCSPAGAA